MVLGCPESRQRIKSPDFAGGGPRYIIRRMAKPASTGQNVLGQNVSSPVANPQTVAPGKSEHDAAKASKRPREIGGPSGPEPTRYGDWERNGRVSDF
jgi:hypothetical protein